jgi:hypothetical protein
MENFMKFAASLNSASQHLNKTQTSQKPKSPNLSWHSPHGFQVKQEKTEVDDKSFQKSLKGLREDNNWNVDQKTMLWRYPWSKPEEMCHQWNAGFKHPAYRGEVGYPWEIGERHQINNIKKEPVTIL